jgi:hypothetical protein
LSKTNLGEVLALDGVVLVMDGEILVPEIGNKKIIIAGTS